MVEQAIKIKLVLLIILILYSCQKNTKQNTIYNEETLYLYDTCALPLSSGILIKQKLSYYKTPRFLKPCFDKVINKECLCPCYNENTTGYDLLFYSDSLENKVQINTIHKVHIGSYMKHSGLFLYRNHLFFCRGNYEIYDFDIIKKMYFFSYKPLDIWAEPKRGYYGYSQWWFEIDKNNEVKLKDYYECN